MYVNGVKVASNGIPYSRILMSWIRAGGENYVCSMKDWLLSIGLTEEEAEEIRTLHSWGGKFELEENAKGYLQEHGRPTIKKEIKDRREQELKDLKERHENFGFALCGIIGRLYEYLGNEYWITEKVPKPVAMAYCEAVDAMLNEGATEVGYAGFKYNMDDLEELSENLKACF